MPNGKLPKRKRIFTRKRHKSKPLHDKSIDYEEISNKSVFTESEVATARGRLKGALMDAFDQSGDDTDGSENNTPVKRERKNSNEPNYHSSGDEDLPKPKSPQRQSYVLKLFDRSVDLSQFNEDSALYPICRAWIANKPKAKYSDFGKEKIKTPPEDDSIELPGPEGPPISRIPDLIPEQKACSKDNINLNYRGPAPSRETLLHAHATRWAAVRAAWLQRAAAVEARYSRAQAVLAGASSL